MVTNEIITTANFGQWKCLNLLILMPFGDSAVLGSLLSQQPNVLYTLCDRWIAKMGQR